MLYRIHQFIRAIFPYINPADLTWALNKLTPEAADLFLQQSQQEQRHAIDVANSIVKASHSLSFDDFQNLITAALLHDCGKSTISIRLWQRIYIVLMQKMPKKIWSRLERGHSIFSFSLKIDARHAQWGGSLAKNAGLNSAICLLIREHHHPTTDLGRILERADNLH